MEKILSLLLENWEVTASFFTAIVLPTLFWVAKKTSWKGDDCLLERMQKDKQVRSVIAKIIRRLLKKRGHL